MSVVLCLCYHGSLFFRRGVIGYYLVEGGLAPGGGIVCGGANEATDCA